MDDSSSLIKKRQEKILKIIKEKSTWIAYAGLALVIYIAVWIRTRNLSGLRDITTGGWTLGPDLDPFLFLRYAKYIIENGSLMSLDLMRYVPLGVETGDFSLHYYSIAWFHKIASIFGSTSVDQSASLFPVFMFGLTVIAFFLLSRKTISNLFDRSYANIGALVSALLFSLFPVFIPRTIAGIPEKESSAFLFMFLALYFFIQSWDNSNKRNKILFGVFAGLSTGLMALIWGAYSYIFFIIVPAAFVAFLIGNFEKGQIIPYSLWILSSLALMITFSNRYGLGTTFTSFDRGVAILLLLCVCFYHYIYPKIETKITSNRKIAKIPPRLLSTLLFGIGILILAMILYGPGFIVARINEIYYNFVRPATSRLIQTVAENRQPYLTEWIGNFGPQIGKVFVSFWMALIGSVLLFWNTISGLEVKDRIKLTASFVFMLVAIIYSRYSSSSLFNGENFVSILFYVLGIIIFLITFIAIYYLADKKSELNKFRSVRMEFLIFFSFLFIALVSARGFIRLVMILVPPVSIAIGYLVSFSLASVKNKFKDKILPIIVAGILLIAFAFTAYQLYISSSSLAANYVPSPYTQQWQKSMAWVRENTPENSVFGHWWDYGYWVQSIGERATALDGGNNLPYWNHLMGRYALTESNIDNTYQFLYAHNVTHFLIDSTDIGKYSAFSTIGSDATYDRRSWIPTFLKDSSQTTQRKNTTVLVYSGGTSIDGDIRYNLNGSELFLPEGKSYIAAIVISTRNDGTIEEVLGAYYYQEKLYQIPLRYYWTKDTGLIDTGRGIDAGAMIYPRVSQNSAGGGDIDPLGATLYLSPRTVNTNLANYYLFGKNNPNFKLVNSQPDIIVEILKDQNIQVGDFVYFNEFRGPIKIWEITYPKNMILNQSYLETDYPDSIRLA